MIRVSEEEEGLLLRIPKEARAELYLYHRSLKTDKTFTEYLRGYIDNQEKMRRLGR